LVKLAINILELYTILRIFLWGLQLVRGKNKGIAGKTLLLLKKKINRRLDKALERQQALSGKNIVEFKKRRINHD
jgi:hypothetical protein